MNETEPKAGKISKSALAARAMRQEKFPANSYFAGSKARTAHMLSYLNKAQLQKWNSYSPARQRRIMEEIEKKLERKIPDALPLEERKAPSDNYDISAYEDEESKTQEYHIRGHPADIQIRTAKEMQVRQNMMTLREFSPGAANGAFTGASLKYAAKKASSAGKKPRSAYQKRKKPLAEGKELLIKPEAKSSTGRAKTQGGTVDQTRQVSRNKTLAGGVKVFPDQKGEPSVKGRPNIFRQAGSMKLRDAKNDDTKTNETKGQQRHRLQAGEILRPYQRFTGGESTAGGGGNAKPPDGSFNAREKRTREEKEPAFTLGMADSQKAAGHLSQKAHSGVLPSSDKAALATSGGRGRMPQVVIQKEKPQKEILRSTLYGRETKREKRLTKKAEKRKAARYTKAFLSELTTVIEKDMARDRNIARAQKSGQIEASVAELTGQSGRSAFRITSIPIKVSLNILAKRLREEIKKKVREAAAALMRYAATFGAPVFAVVIIVMLLSAICMIGTTQNQPQGTGLGFRIVQEAKKHLGLPYVYGGTSLTEGCDCSGFVWAIYNIFGYNLPRTAGEQYAYGRKVGSDISDWQLGDLIYYSQTGEVQSGGGRAEHIVIYIGGGQVISCGPVAIYNWDYRSDYYGTCRIIPDEPTGGDFSGSTNEEICWNYFISQGFSEAAAAGILGNMYVESGGTFDPSIHQYGGGPGRGLCQWEESYSGGSGRYNNLAAFAASLGKEWDDITAQLQFVSYELDSGAMNPYFSPFGGVEAFKNSTDPTTATYVFLCGFEYCGDPGTSFLESNFALSTRVDHAGWAYLNYQ